MSKWLISYLVCGIGFTAVMYIRNLQKNERSLIAEIKNTLSKKKTARDRSIEIIGNSLAFGAVSALWIFFLCWLIYEKYLHNKSSETFDKQKFNATQESLICIIDPEVEERNHMINDPLGRTPNLPFGHLHQAWINFLAHTEPTDSIWSFEIKVGDMVTTWYSNEKRPSIRLIKGYACLNSGEIVNEFIYEGS